MVDALVDAGVPAAPVNRPSDLVDDPHLSALDLLVDVETEDDSVQAMLTPLSGTDVDVSHRRDPPSLGADTATVFESVGLGDRYDDLESAGAFGTTDRDVE